ncbi:DoxX family protein [Peribacillus psychrosaccharolyticus]|uniref:DoxX family protein n=1 Tax=Peribacillus psychrosaccharolyticus TaxID=1407 RepID=A0A974NMF5_PERPY|nr:DoxX family protein [Peribacillus psychrosaccharolyticus]MEC2056510.1 DoxX family protein [Peribacillus psychrosaccharolyticus]MED3745642.1 DoxX family protein [Peribacillus psychrosaccharolyticus]QQT00345.1 DoxX family protein [Peribacillus psychrosaccharolyticus]
MMLKNEIGALILRVTLGTLFLIHGIVKFQGGIENIVGWFESIGLPGFMAYGVALVEIFGGIALIIGLATRFISALFALLMIGATLKVKLSVGLLGNGQMAGYELDLAFLAIALYLVFNGSQILSVSQLFFHKDSNELKRVA